MQNNLRGALSGFPSGKQPWLRLVAWAMFSLLLGALGGCASPSGGHTPGKPFEGNQLLQSDSGRFATLAMRDNLDALAVLLDKLYRRNPQMWRKAPAESREAAVAQVVAAIAQHQALPGTGGVRDIAAVRLAFEPNFEGDRAGTLIYGLGTMLITAHGEKVTFYLTDTLNDEHLYNAARNVEIAVWLLNTKQDAQNQAMLLANGQGNDGLNVSFEREFGKIIARLDLLAVAQNEKYRRAGINLLQNLMGGQLFQFLPVR